MSNEYPKSIDGGPEAISVKGLERRFDGIEAVRSLTFEVKRGEVVVFLGPNGAGKTTTMRILAGLLTPSAGSARVLGRPPAELPYELRSRLGYLPESPRLYEALSPSEFLDFVADLHGLELEAAGAAKREMLAFFGLEAEAHRAIAELSMGTRKRVALAGVFLHRPDIALLDEPTGGLDPRAAASLKSYLLDMARERGLTVFLSTHMLEMAEKLCDRVLILHRGRLVADGTLESLRERTRGAGSLEQVFLELTSSEGTK